MPESIDWPTAPTARRRRSLFLILAVLAAIFFGGRAALSYYVDVLWFGSLGYGDVFWRTLTFQWGIFAGFTAATFVILYGSFLALKRAHLPDLPGGHTIFIGGQPLKYHRQTDGRFVLYSVGWNETDEGGKVVLGGGTTPAVDLEKGDWVWEYPAE